MTKIVQMINNRDHVTAVIARAACVQKGWAGKMSMQVFGRPTDLGGMRSKSSATSHGGLST